MIKVVLVDDSRAVTEVVKKLFNHLKTMELLATFNNPLEALKFFKVYQPDVVILDMEMPQLDGLSTLERIMKDFPMPVVLFSSYMQRGSANAVKALKLSRFQKVIGHKFM